MFGRRYIAVLLVIALSAVACEEGLPVAPTVPFAVTLASAPATLTATPSTGVTVTVDGVERELAWHTAFALVMNLDVDQDPVDITSLTITVRQTTDGIIVTPTPPDVELFRFEPMARGNRIDPGGEEIVEFDVWYLLPNGGGEAVVTASVTFTQRGGLVGGTLEIPVAP